MRTYIALLLALAICCLPLVCGAVSVDQEKQDDVTAEEYGLSVGGVTVNEQNAADVLGDGRVRFDKETNTLTLSGVTLKVGGKTTSAEGYSETAAISTDSSKEFTIHLAEGTVNRIALTEEAEGTYHALFGIASSMAPLHITGGGTLEVVLSSSCKGGAFAYGISSCGLINESRLFIFVKAVSQEGTADAQGICSYGNIENKGYMVLNAAAENGDGGYGYSFGINGYGDLKSTGSLKADTAASDVSYALCITGEGSIDAAFACQGAFEGNYFVLEGQDVPAASVWFGDQPEISEVTFDGTSFGQEKSTAKSQSATAASATPAPTKPGGERNKGSLLWLWILLGLLGALALSFGAFVFWCWYRVKAGREKNSRL